METTILVATISLILVFSMALQAKLFGFAAFRQSLAGFGLPTEAQTPVAFLTVAAEGLAIVLLVVAPLWLAATYTVALLGAFTIMAAIALLRGRRPQCQCFGNLAEGEIGTSTVLRNVVLAGAAALLLFATDTLPALVRSMQGTDLVMAGMALTILGLSYVLIDVLRRYGNALNTLDAVGVDHVTHQPKRGLPPGAPVPELPLAGANGMTLSLMESIDRSSAEAIVLISTSCGHCTELIPAIQRAADSGWQGLLLVQGHESHMDERLRGLPIPRLFAEDPSLSEAFNIAGFPAHVPLDGHGKVKGGTLLGRQAIEDALDGKPTTIPEKTLEESDDQQDRPHARTPKPTIGSV